MSSICPSEAQSDRPRVGNEAPRGADAAAEAAQRQLVLPLARPVVTWVLLAINVAIWIAMALAGGSEDPSVLIRFGAKVDYLVVKGEWWRLFTANFIHIGMTHLLVNGYALVSLGREVESLLGHARFVLLYGFAGVCGTLLSFAFGSAAISAGASTGLFGLLGSLLAFLYLQRRLLGERGRTHLRSTVAVAAANLALGFVVPGIDNFGHLGGLIGGTVLGWLVVPRYEVELAGSTGVARLVDGAGLRASWQRVALAVVVLVGLACTSIWWRSRDPGIYFAQGQRLLAEGRNEDAAAEFERAVALGPDSIRAHFALGYARSQQAEWIEAALAFETVLNLDPTLESAYWNLAVSYAKLGRAEDAVRELRHYTDLNPSENKVDKAQEFIFELSAEQ